MAKKDGGFDVASGHRDGAALANLNLKVTEEERWAFKEFCVKNRMSQVDGFRRAFELLKEHGASK